MDPFVAISLASSVFTFVDFGIKTVKVVVEIAKSPERASAQNREIEEHAESLDVFCANINDSIGKLSLVQPCKEELNILKLSQQAVQLAKELKDDLNALKPRPGEDAIKVAAKAIRVLHEARTVQKKNEKLKQLSERIQKELLAALYQTNSAKMREILEKQSMHSKLQIQSHLMLDDIKKDLIRVLDLMQLGHVTNLKQNIDSIRAHEKRLREEEKRLTLEQNMLKFLGFEGMHDRRNRIVNKHEHTFGWFFDDRHEDQTLGFGPWLKAGSGIFWISGDGLQRSCIGLLRTLLYELLRQFPSTIEQLPDDLCSEFLLFKDQAWASTKSTYGGNEYSFIEQLSVAITKVSANIRVCFFIDGLDEFDGHKEELIKILKKLANLPDVKMCVSSRPWTEFEEAFSDSIDNIVLHEHNMADIRNYAKETLESHTAFTRLALYRSEYDAMMDTLVDRAKGVFLWIFLVVRSLESGISNRDSIEELKLRIERFPPNLTEFFQRMLESIDPEYCATSAQILLMLLYSRSSVSIFTFQNISEVKSSNSMVSDLNIDSWDQPNFYEDAQIMLRLRLKARCKDLVDIFDTGSDHNWASRLHIGLLHRTIFDFLALGENQRILTARAGSQFHAAYELGKYTVTALGLYCSLYNNNRRFRKTLAGSKIVSHEDGDDCCILIRRIVESCHTATLQTGEMPKEVLRRAEGILDSSDFELTRKIAAKYSLSSHFVWSTQDLILIPSIEVGFLRYVDHRFRLNKSRGDTGRGNLSLGFVLHLASTGYTEDITKIMLQDGAQVNEDFEGVQFWKYYLRTMLKKVRGRKDLDSAKDALRQDEFARMMILLVQHGADLFEHIELSRMNVGIDVSDTENMLTGRETRHPKWHIEERVALDVVRELCFDDDYKLILAHVQHARANTGWLTQFRKGIGYALHVIGSA